MMVYNEIHKKLYALAAMGAKDVYYFSGIDNRMDSKMIKSPLRGKLFKRNKSTTRHLHNTNDLSGKVKSLQLTLFDQS